MPPAKKENAAGVRWGTRDRDVLPSKDTPRLIPDGACCYGTAAGCRERRALRLADAEHGRARGRREEAPALPGLGRPPGGPRRAVRPAYVAGPPGHRGGARAAHRRRRNRARAAL